MMRLNRSQYFVLSSSLSPFSRASHVAFHTWLYSNLIVIIDIELHTSRCTFVIGSECRDGAWRSIFWIERQEPPPCDMGRILCCRDDIWV